MKTIAIAGCAILAASAASIGPGEAGGRQDQQADPSFPLVQASPGLYRSGAECAPDRAEAAWGPNNRLLGYICVRSPSNAH